MKQVAIRGVVPVLLMSFLACAAEAQSLGEIARTLRAERAEQQQKATKVYTNDNIPHTPGIEASSSTGAAESKPAIPQGQAGSSNPAMIPAEEGAQSGAGQAAAANSAGSSASGESAQSPMKSKVYWQTRFHNARAALAQAKELQGLDEDELSLLQLQRARELDPSQGATLDTQIATKQSVLAARRAETQKAQKALDEVEKEFKESGAPAEWGETD